MSIGYQDDPIKTLERFILHPFSKNPEARLFRTGDRARWRSDGSVEILGRLDFQVKIGGYRVEPEAIESVLSRHPQIREAVVVAQKGKDDDNRLIAYLVLHSQAPTVRDLRAFLEGQLPAHQIPALFVQLRQLPRRPNGKIDRQALPSPEMNPLETGNRVVSPQTPAEKILVNLWSEVLELPVKSIQDRFFELGGTSLKATRLLAAIDQTFQKRLTPGEFYLHSTISRLAHLLETGQHYASSGSLIEIRQGGSLTPLYFSRGMYGGGFVCEPIFKALPHDQPIYGFAYEDESRLTRRGESLEEMARSYCEELVALQPTGPLRLAGFSFGGMLAFEMARQLADRHRCVELLIIMDIGPGRPVGGLQNQLLQYFRILSNLPQKLALKISRRRSRKAPLPHPSGPQTTPFVPPRSNDPSALLKYTRTLRHQRHLSYSGPVVLIRATVRPFLHSFAPDLGWSDLLTGPFEILSIPGDHHSILEEPHVQGLARAFRQAMNSVSGIPDPQR